MARIQILELPMEHHGDETITPFILILDQYDEQQRYVLEGENIGGSTSALKGVAEQIGARAVLAFAETVDIPANNIEVDGCSHPATTRVETNLSGFGEAFREGLRNLPGEFGPKAGLA